MKIDIVGDLPAWALPRNPEEQSWNRAYINHIRSATARGRVSRRRFRKYISGENEYLLGENVDFMIKDTGTRLELPSAGATVVREDLCCFERPGAVLFGLPPHWRLLNPPSRRTRLLIHGGSRVVLSANTFVGPGVYLTVNNKAKFEMGISTYIGHDCNINCRAGIIIGAGSLIGQQTAIMDYDGHPVFPTGKIPSGDVYAGTALPIHIGQNVWIGFRSIILKGVTIGNGAIIGSGSIVSSNIPERCIAAGNPARIIRRGVTWKRY